MENRKLIRLSLIVFSTVFTALFLAIPKTHAYDYETHAFLTQEIVKLYDKTSNLSPNLSAYLIDGSRREDDSPRWLHHFYDPIYNRGYSYDPKTGALLNIGSSHESSKLWAQDPGKQNEPTYKVASLIASVLDSIQQKTLNITTESDFTWNAALDYWANNEKEKAMFALGHVLHLIEDASVPDHTRNNGHADGSPYEQWTAQFNRSNPDPQFATYMQSKQPIVFASLDDYFNSIANYSNKGFYSKDTIGIQSGYNDPQPDYFAPSNVACFAIKIDQDGNAYNLYKKVSCNTFIAESALMANLDDNKVLLDYWSRLGPQAVQHGAGALALFFQEAQQHQKQQSQSWIDQIKQWLKLQTQSIQTLFGTALQLEQSPIPTEESLIFSPAIATPIPAIIDTIALPEEPPPANETPLPSDFPTPPIKIITTPTPTQALTLTPTPTWPQFLHAQTPNTSSETPMPIATPSPEETPVSMETITLTPEPVPSASPSPQISIQPSPDPSPTQTPVPTPWFQQSNNEFFSNVAWYFDQSLATEQGGTFTMELDVQKMLAQNDFHTLIAAWNTDLALTAGTKQEGGNALVPQYAISNQTGIFVDAHHPLYGPAETSWQWQGTYDPASREFPQHIVIHPTNVLISYDNWLRAATSSGITRQEMESELGRPVGTHDFITLGYWPLYHNQTPLPDNVHYFGSFLDAVSEPTTYPVPPGISNLQYLRWGPNNQGQWTIEFMYSLPLIQVLDPWSSSGYKMRFHLNSTADFLYGFDITLGAPGFLENGANGIVVVQYQTCDWNSSFSGRQGFRYPLNGSCSISGFNATAINPNQLSQTQNPEQGTWIVSLPIWNIPKDISSLSAADYLTASLLVWDAGPSTGLYLRQIDSRQWHFSSTYTPLALPTPIPEISPSPPPDITPSPEASPLLEISPTPSMEPSQILPSDVAPYPEPA